MLTLTAMHMRTRIDTPVSTILGATDACDDASFAGIGGVECKISKALSLELYRCADISGERVSLGRVLHQDQKGGTPQSLGSCREDLPFVEDRKRNQVPLREDGGHVPRGEDRLP